MTREEVSIQVGAEMGSLERQLGMGRNYLQRWRQQVKSDSEQYTDWWKQELKKREEAQVASDVRAAQRSNMARKLLRQRTEERADRISSELGQGSVPESWRQMTGAANQSSASATKAFKKWGAETSAEISKTSSFLGFAFEGSFRKTLKTLKSLVAVNLVTMGFEAVQLWDDISKKIADVVFGNSSKVSQYFGQSLEQNRNFLRKFREDEEKRKADEAKASDEAGKRAQERVAKDQEIAELANEQYMIELGPNSEQADRRKTKQAERRKYLAEQELNTARQGGNRDQIQNAELALEKAKLELLKNQTAAKEKQATIEKEMLEQKREQARIQQGELEKFMPTLEELSERGAFRKEAWDIQRLDKRIKRDFVSGDTAGAKRDMAERDRIYDSIAAKGIMPEREEKRRMSELAEKTEQHLSEIASGKKVITVRAKME